MRECNDLLRSAHAIAKRKGKDTNWEAFEAALRKELMRQHGGGDEARATYREVPSEDPA